MLATLGIASIAITIAFTIAMCRGEGAAVGQSRRASMIEAWFNITIGLGINLAANWVFLPLVGVSVTLVENLWLGAIYTSVSVMRAYIIRRWFNARLKLTALYLAGSGNGAHRF